ncbi:PREDICTED: osteopetrosis-associated transmembrane protein 1-like [Bactrocera latifrons]|uniref:Osteopetrosis-associated transmembrane protein 1 n=2 Tax=Bactrocera latifrons TaxID=174628 RepID=A0A0K8TV68_BACLA|nr:PREDICTED: osteopetrosis-associated transmembrane protein 1-like [Bactrocera latifrons]
MCSYSILMKLIPLLFVVHHVLAENICNKYLRELAQKQSVFVQCSTLHSVPVRLCIGCQTQFTEMQDMYSLMRKEDNCTEKFFDKDRINIVSTTQSILTGLWTKAYCDDCFHGNNSDIFDSKRINLEVCLRENKGKECVLCLTDYLDLNEFYVDLDKQNNGQVCYDMQDSMNRTRVHWSKDLDCCHRKFDMLLFLITCGIVVLLPLLFYSSTYALTKRQERYHDILTEEPRYNAPSTSAMASSSVADLPSTSSTATCPRVPSKKNIIDIEEYTSSDGDDEYVEAKTTKTRNKMA